MPRRKKEPFKTRRASTRVEKPSRRSKLFAIAGGVVLFITTAIWSFFGAITHEGNADQPVNAYLFESSDVFKESLWPAQHTFLLKWPLFLVAKFFGYSESVFIVLTMFVALATVGLFAWLLYRIERRPYVFGTICLALASALLLVPAQPYAGGILPVNMAMLTTRNLEYILYIVALLGFITCKGFRNQRFWWAIAGMALLIASDKLFMTLAIGGAVMATAVYTVFRKWEMVRLALVWLAGSLLATVIATIFLWLLNVGGIVNVVGQENAGPYPLVTNLRDLILGGLYGVLGIFTNLGANPAYDATRTAEIPGFAMSRLLSPVGFGYLFNIVVALIGIFTVAYVLLQKKLDEHSKLAHMLFWSTGVAMGAYMFTKHGFAIDARYVTLGMFTIFICIAIYAAQRKWQPRHVAYMSVVAIVAIVSGLFGAVATQKLESAAMSTVNKRNNLVAQMIGYRPVDVLVGDYWRVIPTKLAANRHLAVMPLATCNEPRGVLSSAAWQLDLKKRSFAYLLSLDRSMTDYPQCNLEQVIAAYGHPSRTALIDGTLDNPKEILLFYSSGTNDISKPAQKPQQPPVTVAPQLIGEQESPDCPSGRTIMNFVAHQDDDLLFMNPDIDHAIDRGDCVRTVYLTAGDAGSQQFYWLNRERGSQAAYDRMVGPEIRNWTETIVKIGEQQYMTIARPRDNSAISLVFMRLPDGNVNGEGFGGTRNESLAQSEADGARKMQSVDGQSTYGHDDIVQALVALMNYYGPAEVNTMANYASETLPDHSDHMAVGRYVKKAVAQYSAEGALPIKFYIGYQVQEMEQNVFDSDLAEKQAIFFEYAKFDGGVCGSVEQCSAVSYGAYLGREYQHDM